MGREIKRVPLDFDHPIDKLWPGYCQPCPRRTCEPCGGSGSSAEGVFLEMHARMIAVAAEENTRKRHPYTAEVARYFGKTIPPLTRLHELTEAMAGRTAGGFGHDTIDIWNIKDAIVKAAGLPEDWTACQACSGTGENPADAHLVDPEPYDPPSGDGWQLWSTTTEGHPMSPVFATAEDLARWLADTGASSFGSSTATYDEWLKFCGVGWAPSMVSGPNGVTSGVASVRVAEGAES